MHCIRGTCVYALASVCVCIQKWMECIFMSAYYLKEQNIYKNLYELENKKDYYLFRCVLGRLVVVFVSQSGRSCRQRVRPFVATLAFVSRHRRSSSARLELCARSRVCSDDRFCTSHAGICYTSRAGLGCSLDTRSVASPRNSPK